MKQKPKGGVTTKAMPAPSAKITSPAITTEANTATAKGETVVNKKGAEPLPKKASSVKVPPFKIGDSVVYSPEPGDVKSWYAEDKEGTVQPWQARIDSDDESFDGSGLVVLQVDTGNRTLTKRTVYSEEPKPGHWSKA